MGFSRKSPGGVPGAPSVPGHYATQCGIMPTDVTQRMLPKMEERPALSSSEPRQPPRRKSSFLWVASAPGTALSANTRTGAHGRRSDATHVTQCYANRKNRSFVTDAAPLLGRDPLPFFLARTASARPPQYVRLFFAIRAGPAPTIAAPLPSAGSPLAAKVNPMISKAKWFRPLQFGSSVKRAHDAQFRINMHNPRLHASRTGPPGKYPDAAPTRTQLRLN